VAVLQQITRGSGSRWSVDGNVRPPQDFVGLVAALSFHAGIGSWGDLLLMSWTARIRQSAGVKDADKSRLEARMALYAS
jgi:hypothetical protein